MTKTCLAGIRRATSRSEKHPITRSSRSARTPFTVFFLEFGRCRTKARSLYERKHKKKFVQGHQSIGLGKSIKPTKPQTKQNNNPKATTRKSPSQTCVSPAEKQSNSKTKQKHRTGPEPNQNNHVIDLPQDAVDSTASFAKAC